MIAHQDCLHIQRGCDTKFCTRFPPSSLEWRDIAEIFCYKQVIFVSQHLFCFSIGNKEGALAMQKRSGNTTGIWTKKEKLNQGHQPAQVPKFETLVKNPHIEYLNILSGKKNSKLLQKKPTTITTRYQIIIMIF